MLNVTLNIPYVKLFHLWAPVTTAWHIPSVADGSTWTPPDGITKNQIDHVLVDKRRQSSIIDVRSLRGADCDTDYYPVVVTIRERLLLIKKGIKLHLVADRCDLNKLFDHETRKEYQIDVGNRFQPWKL